jgi:hypothetical protein
MQSIRDEYDYYIRSGNLRAIWASSSSFSSYIQSKDRQRNFYIGHTCNNDAVYDDCISIL